MMAPALKNNEKHVEDPTEYFLTTLHLLVNLMTSFKDIATSFRTVGSIRGVAQRINNVFDFNNNYLKDLYIKNYKKENIVPIKLNKNNEIIIKNINIYTPNNELLLKNISLDLKNGNSLYIKGPNGSGKTSLLRVLSGIWPAISNSVDNENEKNNSILSLPSDCNILFIPQRSYTLNLNTTTIREQLIYPNNFLIKNNKNNNSFSDKQLLDVLNIVGLKIDNKNDLDKKGYCLGYSGGQNQRLICARILLLAKENDIIFLDEITSACSVDFEEMFFKLLKELNITFITISHRNNIEKYHDLILEIDNKNKSINVTKN